MKRIFVSLLMAVGISGPFASQLAAQSNSQDAEIPFAFIAYKCTLPAGTYHVSELRTGSSVFLLRDSRGHSRMVSLGVNETSLPENPSLTFACYGKQCVLAKITPPNSLNAYALTQSGIDKRLPHKIGMASMIAIKLKAH